MPTSHLRSGHPPNQCSWSPMFMPRCGAERPAVHLPLQGGGTDPADRRGANPFRPPARDRPRSAAAPPPGRTRARKGGKVTIAERAPADPPQPVARDLRAPGRPRQSKLLSGHGRCRTPVRQVDRGVGWGSIADPLLRPGTESSGSPAAATSGFHGDGWV